MLRIVIQTSDYGDAMHVGGQVVNKLKTFDVDLPEVEQHLREYTDVEWSKRCMNRSVVGIEVLPTAAETIEPFEIKVNGATFRTYNALLSYEQVRDWACVATEHPTVTYWARIGHATDKRGSLLPGQTVEVVNAMVFDCVDTSKA